MKKLIVVCLLAIFIGQAVFAGKVIGEIIFLKGQVSLTRNGSLLPANQLKIGTKIEDFDLIRTGKDGTIDLIIKTPQNQSIQLSVRNNTTFSIETSKLGAKNSKTTFEMMTGTLSCKVDKLAGNEVQIKTKSAAMGVKGTQFTVTTVPTDDILVTCSEGKVSCRSSQNVEYFAEPGIAVEASAEDEKLKKILLKDKDLEAFRKMWFEDKLNVFKANASRVIFQFSTLFEKVFNELNNIFTELGKKKTIFNKWIEEDKKGIFEPEATLRREKKEVIGLLLKAKGKLYIFDRIYFRLLELELYYQEGYGQQKHQGFSPKDFFAKFQSKKKQAERLIYSIRYLIKLYALRNDGYFPVDTDNFEFESEDNFFNN